MHHRPVPGIDLCPTACMPGFALLSSTPKVEAGPRRPLPEEDVDTSRPGTPAAHSRAVAVATKPSVGRDASANVLPFGRGSIPSGDRDFGSTTFRRASWTWSPGARKEE